MAGKPLEFVMFKAVEPQPLRCFVSDFCGGVSQADNGSPALAAEEYPAYGLVCVKLCEFGDFVSYRRHTS